LDQQTLSRVLPNVGNALVWTVDALIITLKL